VDLIGSQSLTPKDSYTPSDKERELERKVVNQQLLSFSKVITELARFDQDDIGLYSILYTNTYILKGQTD
jgi:hypothetical protein